MNYDVYHFMELKRTFLNDTLMTEYIEKAEKAYEEQDLQNAVLIMDNAYQSFMESQRKHSLTELITLDQFYLSLCRELANQDDL